MSRSTHFSPLSSLSRALFLALLLVCALVSGVPVGAALEEEDAAGTTYIFLSRHAEAVNPFEEDPRNPPLGPQGETRAQFLAHVLKDAGVTRVLSTDYRRTRSTAAPLALALGLEVEIYDAGKLAEVAAELRTAGGRIYVAGHSNTTPELVELLGGASGGEIDHRWEYDRLYSLVIRGDHVASTLIRYGDASVPSTSEH